MYFESAASINEQHWLIKVNCASKKSIFTPLDGVNIMKPKYDNMQFTYINKQHKFWHSCRCVPKYNLSMLTWNISMLIYNIGKLSCNIDTMYIAFIISLIAMHVQYTFVGKVSTCTCSMQTSMRSARGLYTSSTSYKFLYLEYLCLGLLHSSRGYYVHTKVITFTQVMTFTHGLLHYTQLLHSYRGYSTHTRVITFIQG